jgi:hypothetical protein
MMIDTRTTTTDTPKVDVEELVREFKVMNIDVFTSYLKEVWRVRNQKHIYLHFSKIRISPKEVTKS